MQFVDNGIVMHKFGKVCVNLCVCVCVVSAAGRVDAAASLRSSSAMAASITLEISASEFRLGVPVPVVLIVLTLGTPDLPSSVPGGKSSTDSVRTCGLYVGGLRKVLEPI